MRGTCDYETKTISLIAKYAPFPDDVEQIMRHEIAHAFTLPECERQGEGFHGPLWIAVARLLGVRPENLKRYREDLVQASAHHG